MRFATFEHHGSVRSGIVSGAAADALLHPLPDGVTVLDLVTAGLPVALAAGAAALSGPGVPIEDVRLLPPLNPPTIRDFVAFEEHVEGVVASVGDGAGVVPEWYEAPTFYFTNPYALIGAHDPVQIPSGCRLFDFELEVAAVVGRTGRSLTPDEVEIFGYTIMNDWSARDVQAREMAVRLGPSKGKDFATTLGPVLVTVDEVADLVDEDGFLQLELEVLVNGVTVGTDLLGNMGWPFEELVAYASRDTRVVPGDVLGSGTCGRGCLAELWGRAGDLLPSPLVLGDEVVMRVERLGEIRNVIAESRETPSIPPARVRSRARTRAEL